MQVEGEGDLLGETVEEGHTEGEGDLQEEAVEEGHVEGEGDLQEEALLHALSVRVGDTEGDTTPDAGMEGRALAHDDGEADEPNELVALAQSVAVTHVLCDGVSVPVPCREEEPERDGEMVGVVE